METEFALSQIDTTIRAWPGDATRATGTSANGPRQAATVHDQATSPTMLRTRAQVAGFFDG
jgi:hypothetical protein